MARYSRRRGPSVDFFLTSGLNPVPGFDVVRHFGRGVLDLRFSGSLSPLGITPINTFFSFLVDGVGVPVIPFQSSIATDTTLVACFSSLEPIEPGFHLVQVAFDLGNGISSVLHQRFSEFIVIELPEWDQDDDLITL